MKSYEDTLDDTQRRIYRDGQRLKAMRKSRINAKFDQLINADEQMRVNRYHEGYCYGCAKMDSVLSSLWFACRDCSSRRGREGLMAMAAKKHAEEFCDFCARWRLEVAQINVSMCASCRSKVEDAHKKYREMGGRDSNPFHRRMVRKYGTDYQAILKDGITIKRI